MNDVALTSPLVSIVMPVFNGATTIRQTIESVQAQTFKNFEFLIVNDCSIDTTRDIVLEFQKTDPRIKLIDHQKNSHICVALNTGVKNAQGKYLARIDADDQWKPEKLSKQVAFMEENKEYGLCFSLVEGMDENGDLLKEEGGSVLPFFATSNKMRQDFLRHLFYKSCCFCHSSAFIRKTAIDKVGGYYNVCHLQIQDWELWTRILGHFPAFVLQETLVKYRWTFSDKNLSFGSADVIRRSNTEIYLYYRNFFSFLKQGDFEKIFRRDFLNPNSSTALELECEKALILATKSFANPNAAKLVAVDLLYDLFQSEESRTLLESKFNFNQFAFYNLAKEVDVTQRY